MIHSIPGKYAVERYPLLRYVPSFLAPWKAEVLAQRAKDVQLYTDLMNEVKRRRVRGVQQPCFATHLLDEQEALGMSDIEVAYTAGSPFGAGVETVRLTSHSRFISRMLTERRPSVTQSQLAHSRPSSLPALTRAIRSSPRHRRSWTVSSDQVGCRPSMTSPASPSSVLSPPRRSAGDPLLSSAAHHTRPLQTPSTGAGSFRVVAP